LYLKYRLEIIVEEKMIVIVLLMMKDVTEEMQILIAVKKLDQKEIQEREETQLKGELNQNPPQEEVKNPPAKKKDQPEQKNHIKKSAEGKQLLKKIVQAKK
jgi:hypothetical protein